jgi:hypothetical protein
MKAKLCSLVALIVLSFLLYSCNSSTANTNTEDSTLSANSNNYGGYASQAQWGEHLVQIAACSDCHTPKKMTAQGPVEDEALFLSGSPSKAMLVPATPDQVAKGMAATLDLTAWVGPWGKSYAANITSDSTGIGNWTEQQFIYCIRKGEYKGLNSSRPLMPPMPWMHYSQMRDEELKAVFAFLKTTKAVHNIVPQYEPPAGAKK